MEEVALEERELVEREVVWDLLLEVEDGVLDVEADDLADGQLGQRLRREQREALEHELVLVVVDDGRELRRGERRREGSGFILEFLSVCLFVYSTLNVNARKL